MTHIGRSLLWLAVAGFIVSVLAVPALAAGFPDGRYTATIQGHAWKLDFKDGKYTVSRDGKVGVQGAYKFAGKQVTLTDSGGHGAQKGPGVYQWTFSGGKLKFTVVKDGEGGRASVLTAGAFTYAK